MGPIDESFKKPGAVPFKWEIEPGVPRPHSSLKPSPKLTPPPVSAAGKYCYAPPMEMGFLSSTTNNTRSTARSLSVSSRLRSERLRFERPNSVEVISGSTGCFPPLLNPKKKKKRNAKTEELSVDSKEVDDYVCDLETLARRSISTRRMVSPFRDSVCSSSSSSSSSLYGSPSSFSSVRSSPRAAAGDAEWAAFGLF